MVKLDQGVTDRVLVVVAVGISGIEVFFVCSERRRNYRVLAHSCTFDFDAMNKAMGSEAVEDCESFHYG